LTTVSYCYILFIKKEKTTGRSGKVKIIINNSIMTPIYEQIVDQIKTLIRNGDLKENDILPSVRTLSKELKISALTVKKAYDSLEDEGFTVTVHGKGTYVVATNTELLLEEQKKELETDLEKAIQKGRRCGISDEDIRKLFDLIMED
jgi:GntR family transcriptional regulator